MSSQFRDKLVEAQGVLSEHMQDFVQLQFSVELNMEVKSDQTAGPVFMWEPSVDLILQTQDSVVTGVEHLSIDARKFLVGFFSSISNTIMATGVINDSAISPWKGVELEGTIFNGQYGWEGSEFIDYQITKRSGGRTVVGTLTVRDHDLTITSCLEKACNLCDYVLVFVHKPTPEVTAAVIEAKERLGDKIIVRGILSRSATDIYLYPLCRTDTLIVPLNTDMFWSDTCVNEIGRIIRQINISGFRGVDIQDCVLDVAEIKSHPPNAYGLVADHKITYMGNVLKWGSDDTIAAMSKNTCVYREGVEKFARINVSTPGVLRMQHINLSSTTNSVTKPSNEYLKSLEGVEVLGVDASNFLHRKMISRLMRGSARWSVLNV